MLKNVLLLLLAAAPVMADCRSLIWTAAGRAALQLQQVTTRCPAGCASDGCVLDSTSGGYKCISCLNNLVVNETDGACSCPAGRYAQTENDCADCGKGSYCSGGTYIGLGSPGKVDCTIGLTTVGKRSASIKACVNQPGTYYTLDANGNPRSIVCPADAYGPGLRKQRACAPCPPGWTTRGQTGQARIWSCVVPDGFFLKGPGLIAPCPKGEYKAGFDAAASCTSCAAGVTTLTEASTSDAACIVVLPGYYPAAINGTVVAATELCPQKFFCSGGIPSVAFDPASPSALDGTTVRLCANGTWTEQTGSTSADQCLTPPGFKTTITSDGSGTTEPCADGEYRGEWTAAVAASKCDQCGDGILSLPADQVTEYAITPDATPHQVAVRTSAAHCFIKAGQGIYYSTTTNSFKGLNCASNSFGVANITMGLRPSPCRDCPKGMVTSLSLGNSARYFASDAAVPPHQGFISPMACVTKAGYGYNGRIANKCPAGSWNPAGTYSTCTQCGFGLSTPDDAANQVDASNCTLAKGYGSHDGAIQLCPLGTYNDVLRSDTTTACTPCAAGLTTSQAGGVSAADCNVCALGYGGSGTAGATTCPDKCGGSAATYGPAGRDAGSTCATCPEQTVGFSFDYLAQNQNFTPAIVARSGADSPADCLNEFAQIVDAAWYMNGAVALTVVPNATAPTFQACVDDCKADPSCQYITYDYDAAGDKCSKKLAGTGTDVVAYKAVIAGDTSDASINKPSAKGLASGSYTFWKDSGAGIAADLSTSVNVRTVQECLSACDNSADCAGVVMTGITSATGRPATCNLVKGDTTVATFKRSMIKTVVNRLILSDIVRNFGFEYQIRQ